MTSRTQQVTRIKDADDQEWVVSVTPFGASKGFDLLPDVLDLLSPVGSLIDMVGGDGLAMGQGQGLGQGLGQDKQPDLTQTKVKGKALTEAIRTLASVMRDKEGSAFVKRLISDTLIRREGDKGERQAGDTQVFEQTFQANYMFLIKVVGFVIQVNFAPFLKGRLPEFGQKLKSLGQSNQRSNDSTPDQG